MSVHISSWVWRHQDLTPTEKLVMLCLADQANDQGVCWPGIGNIMQRTGLSDRSIQQQLYKLRKMGLVTWQIRPGHSNIYQLPIEVIHSPERRSPPKNPVPPNDVHPTPEPGSPPPPNVVHPESSFESPRKRFSRTREEKPKSVRANSAQGQKPKPRWYESEEGIDKMGRELGMRPAGTETYREYQARISAELRRRAGKE